MVNPLRSILRGNRTSGALAGSRTVGRSSGGPTWSGARPQPRYRRTGASSGGATAGRRAPTWSGASSVRPGNMPTSAANPLPVTRINYGRGSPQRRAAQARGAALRQQRLRTPIQGPGGQFAPIMPRGTSELQLAPRAAQVSGMRANQVAARRAGRSQMRASMGKGLRRNAMWGAAGVTGAAWGVTRNPGSTGRSSMYGSSGSEGQYY